MQNEEEMINDQKKEEEPIPKKDVPAPEERIEVNIDSLEEKLSSVFDMGVGMAQAKGKPKKRRPNHSSAHKNASSRKQTGHEESISVKSLAAAISGGVQRAFSGGRNHEEASEEARHKMKNAIRYVLFAVLIVAALIIVTTVVKNWRYRSYKVVYESTNEDTVSFSYYNLNGYVLKYGLDSAMLNDKSNKTFWTTAYSMTNPQVISCEETCAIYDKQGTSIVVCDKSGKIGAVTTDYPIKKVDIAEQGTVAAILENGSDVRIEYYKKDGSLISTIKPTQESPGYPLDIALSKDGMLLSVSYLFYENAVPSTRLYFYNFGTTGQNQLDNLVSSDVMSGNICPDVCYLDKSTCVAMEEHGFTVYSGSQMPKKKAKIETEEEIVSMIAGEEKICMIVRSSDPSYRYKIYLYDKNGHMICETSTSFSYITAEIVDNGVVLSNNTSLAQYSFEGVEKFNGQLDGIQKALTPLGRNHFLFVSEGSYQIIRLT